MYFSKYAILYRVILGYGLVLNKYSLFNVASIIFSYVENLEYCAYDY